MINSSNRYFFAYLKVFIQSILTCLMLSYAVTVFATCPSGYAERGYALSCGIQASDPVCDCSCKLNSFPAGGVSEKTANAVVGGIGYYGCCCYTTPPDPCGGQCSSDKCVSGICRQCTQDYHCSGYGAGAYCSGYQCYSNPCASCPGRCLNNQCYTCLSSTNAGCSGGTPYCLSNSRCVECLNNTHCGNRICLNNSCQSCTNNPSLCPAGTICNSTTGECLANSNPSLQPTTSDTANLTENGNPLTANGAFSVTDSNSNDVVTVSIKSVSSTGATSNITLNDNDYLGMMQLTPQTVINSGQTTGSFNWNFNSGTETFQALDTGDTLTLTYTVEVKDSNGATSTDTITINIAGIGCLNDNECSGSKPLCDVGSGTCVVCDNTSEADGDTRCLQKNNGNKNICVTAAGSGNIGACGECDNNDNCNLVTTGKYCQLSSNTCQNCSSAADCPAGYECNNGRCEQEGGLCVLGDCLSDSDCSGDKPLCESNNCTACTNVSNPENDNRCNAKNSGDYCLTVGSNSGSCGVCGSNADCPAGYICDNGVCKQGECRTDAECSGNKPLCDTSNNTCVACNASGITGGDGRCDAKDTTKDEVCIGNSTGGNTGACGECDDHNDCQIDTTGEYCDLSNNTCNSCSQDSDCPSGYTCDESTGMCVAGSCVNDNDCSGMTPLCNQSNNTCVACNASGITGGDSRCDAKDSNKDEICIKEPGNSNIGACGECDENEDCGFIGNLIRCNAGCPQGQSCITSGVPNPISGSCQPNEPICNLTSNTCVACNDTTNPCPSGYICINGDCIPGNCSTDADCSGDTPFCEMISGSKECVACNSSGISNSDQRCDDKNTSTDEVCIINSTGGNQGECGECDDNNDCEIDSTGKYCNLSSNTCNNCSADSQCPIGYICDEALGQCKQGDCDKDSDCPDNKPICLNYTCGPCSSDGQCKNKNPNLPVCVNGMCKECEPGNLEACEEWEVCLNNNTCGACTENSQCPAGKVCKNGRCEDGCRTDAECGSGNVCLSGECVAGSWCLNSYQGFIDALPDLSQCQISGKSQQEIRDKFESECAVNSKKAKCILCKKYMRTSAEKVCDATACMFGAPECKPEINKFFKMD